MQMKKKKEPEVQLNNEVADTILTDDKQEPQVSVNAIIGLVESDKMATIKDMLAELKEQTKLLREIKEA